MRFAEYTGGIFEDKLQKGKLDTFKEDSGNKNRQPRHELERQTKARACYREYDMTTMDKLVGLLSQEDQKQTLCSTRQISTRETGPTQPSVIAITHCDAGLKCLLRLLPIAVRSSYIYVSQGSVATQSR